MKAIHILLGLVLFLAFAAGGAALIVSPQYPDFIQMAIAFGASWPAGNAARKSRKRREDST